MKFIKRCGFIFLFYSIIHTANACTLVFDNQHSSKIVARNMDWVENMDINFFVYPEGIAREGYTPINPLIWRAKYGSIVAVAYENMPTDGMNEKGFSAEVLALKESDYGKRDETIPAISIIQWVQFYLDNFATVDEAVRFTENNSFQLIPYYHEKTKLWLNLHLAIEDASGDFAVIEYIHGKPIIYHEKDTTVLTNSPTFNLQLENLKQYAGWGGSKSLPGTTDANQRFVRAAYYLSHLPKPISSRDQVAAISGILQNATQPYGVASSERPFIAYTEWRTFADLTHHIYYFNSLLNLNSFWIQFDKFNLQSGNPILKLDLKNHPDLAGDATNLFEISSNNKFLTSGR
ncbi:MAG TPA: linear amide C-N hydrolase [Gammaproteobacteria bacterium]|nr:linear amide C-N hydrolase [Gammaproteobacteria bacterium]